MQARELDEARALAQKRFVRTLLVTAIIMGIMIAVAATRVLAVFNLPGYVSDLLGYLGVLIMAPIMWLVLRRSVRNLRSFAQADAEPTPDDASISQTDAALAPGIPRPSTTVLLTKDSNSRERASQP